MTSCNNIYFTRGGENLVYKDLERQLQQAREEKGLAEKLMKKLRAAEEQLKESKKKSSMLLDILSKEKRDVDKLQHLSLTNLFATVLGTKEDKLDKERQEYLAAKLKYEASQKAINDLEKEIHSLEQQMEPLRSAGDNYHRLLKEKEEILKHQDSETADELLSLADEEGRLAARTKELGEAEEAARHAILSLGELLDSLGSAANWGTWDMIGGGLISTAIKHSKIDHAREKASEVQSALHSLKRELLDVDINTDLAVEIGGLATFADYFFDGLIVDWVVQSRINEARKRAETVMSQVEQIRQNLRLELEETDRKVLELKERKQKLVEQSEV